MGGRLDSIEIGRCWGNGLWINLDLDNLKTDPDLGQLMRNPVFLVALIIPCLFYGGFGTAGQLFGTLIEEILLSLILLEVLVLLIAVIIYAKDSVSVGVSLVLAITAAGLFIVDVYLMGISLGNQPPGFAEGKFLAVGLVIAGIGCTALGLVAAAMAAYSVLKRRQKAGVALAVSVLAVSIICIPLAIHILPSNIRSDYGLERWGWLSQVYQLESWSRAIEAPVY